MGRALKLLAWAVLAGVVGAGALVWRVSRGPISLDFLNPRIVAALAPPSGRFQVAIGGTELAWAGWQRGLDLRAREVRVLGSGGRVVATLPALALELSVAALLRGAFEPTAIDAIGPSVHLVRHPGGAIDLGLGRSTDEDDGGAMLVDLLGRLRSKDGGASDPGSTLTRLEVSDGTVALEDLESGATWRSPDLDVSIVREGDQITASLGGAVALGADRIAFRGDAVVPEAGGGARAKLVLEGVRPSAVAQQISSEPEDAVARRLVDVVPAFERVDLRLDGTADVDLDATWRPTRVAIALAGESGRILLGGAWEPVEKLGLDLVVDVGAGTAELARLDLLLGGATLRASGSLAGLVGRGSLAAELSVEALPLALGWRAWPAGAAEGARTWLTENVSHGAVGGQVRFAADLTDVDLDTIDAVRVAGDLHYEDLQVRFVETMAPVVGVRGGGTFSQAGFDLGVERGSLDGIAVGPRARVVISGIDGASPGIAIDAPVRGEVATVLRVLDSKPIELAQSIGIRPTDVSGTVDGAVHLAFPLGVDPDGAAGLGLRASARATGVGIVNAVADWSVADADLRIDVNASAVSIQGKAAVEGAPVEVSWTESLDRRAKLQRSVGVTGSLDAAARTRLGLDLEPWLEGPVGLRFDLQQMAGAPAGGLLVADLGPAVIDVPQIAWKKPAGTPGQASGKLRFDGKGLGLAAIDGIKIDAGGLTAQGSAQRAASGEGWSRIVGDVNMGAADHRQPPARAQVSLEGREPGYALRLTSNDCGSLIRAIGLYADAVGGSLVVTGELKPTPSGLDLSTHVELTGVTVTRAPVLARVAGLASLRGVADAFSASGKGIAFDRISGDIAHARRVVTIADGVAAGPTLGLLLAGTIDQANDQVSLRGTLVPQLYGINRLLGAIPIVGSVLGGGSAGGPIGVEYSLDGPTADPKVAVHPLDSLTPAIVKRLVAAIEQGTGRKAEN
jgi:Protein of unknown function/AsmA-like C-terminal region